MYQNSSLCKHACDWLAVTVALPSFCRKTGEQPKVPGYSSHLVELCHSSTLIINTLRVSVMKVTVHKQKKF